MTRRNKSDLVRMAAVSAAAALLLGGAGTAMAAYTSSTTFQEVTADINGAYPMNDPTNWTNGLPDATKLAILGPVAAPPAVPAPMTAYSFQFNSDFGFTLSGSPWTLTSTDSTVDTTALTSPALHYASTGVGEFQLNNNVILGDGSVSTGTAYVKNDSANRFIIAGAIGQAAGTTWGLTILPSVNPASDLYRFRANNNGGSYLTNRFTFTGPLTLETGATVRMFNNILPYGAGLPNTTINGELRHSQNGGTVIINAVDGTGEIDRNAGADVVIGANGANGNFSGVIINGSTNLYKVGGGTQTLSNAANSYSSVAAIEGVLNFNSIADTGADSALGEGDSAGSVTIGGVAVPLAPTALDGGTLQYTGTGHTSNRAVGVGFRGGELDASGTGAVVINGDVAADDFARAFGDNVESGTSSTVTNMYGVEGLGAVASELTIVNVSGFTDPVNGFGVYNVVGTSPVSIDETNRTMELAAIGADGTNPALNGRPGSGQGAPRFIFQSETGLDRTLTLSGTSTADNTLGGVLSDSPLGGKLNVAKTGTGTWVLGNSGNTYTGTTTVNQGTLKIGNGLTKSSAVNAAGGTLEVVNNGTHLNVVKAPSVTVGEQARIDLKNNKLLTDTPVGTWDGTKYTGIQGEVARAYDFGAWDLPGIMTSEADAGPTVGKATIGVATGEQALFLGPTETGVFGGETISGTTAIAMYTWAGDVDLNGYVDAVDYGTIDQWIQFPGTTGYTNGDLNYDGVIDAVDYGIIDNGIQLQGAPIPINPASPAAAASLSGVTAVPEPASLSVLSLAAASLLGRRRRRQSQQD